MTLRPAETTAGRVRLHTLDRSLSGLLPVLAVIAALPTVGLHAQTISINPTTPLVTTISFTGLPGQDFAESLAGNMALSVGMPGGGPGTRPWTVTVHRDAASWHPGLILRIVRTSDGSGGPGVVTAPPIGTMLTIGTEAVVLMVGDRSKTGIAFELGIGGGLAAAGVPAGTYTTTVTYTIASP